MSRLFLRTAASATAAAVLLAACAGPEPEKPRAQQDWQILLGVPSSTEGNTMRFETRDVLTRDPERRPGFVIVAEPPPRLAGNEYELHTVHYLPGEPTELRGEFASEVPEAAKVGLHTPPRTYRGTASLQFHFDEGDPLGPWRVEVYIDGEFKKAVKFQLVEPTESEAEEQGG